MNEVHKRGANTPKTDIFKVERRTSKSKNKTINNIDSIMKKEKIGKIIATLIKILKWLSTLLSKK